MGIGVVGVQLQGAAAVCLGGAVLPAIGQDAGEVGVCGCAGGVERDQRAVDGNGLCDHALALARNGGAVEAREPVRSRTVLTGRVRVHPHRLALAHSDP